MACPVAGHIAEEVAVNETVAETAPPSNPAEALALRQLEHVGWAYGVIFALLFAFTWRLASSNRRLAERIDELERGR
jgi:hypothetical protein